MRSIAITVTKAARSFADCINRVYYQDVTFALLKNGTAVAQLVPVCSGRDHAAILNTVRLSDSESKEWHRDLLASHKTLKEPKDKWK
jgi:hypothetical protein